jgi:PEGA domain
MIRFGTVAVVGLVGLGSLFAQQTGFMKVKVSPGRAGVFVDGKYVGPAANFGIGRKYSLAAGEHKIKLVEPRYEDMETIVKVEAGKTVELKETMKALPEPKGPFGSMRTENADKFAAVYINDHYMGHVDEFSNPWQVLKLPAGEYTVRIEPTSGPPIEKKVTIVVGQTVIVK